MRSASRRFLTLLLVVLFVQLAVPRNVTAQTELSAADRDLLIRVRQAGLWEMPAGDWARTRARDEHVKDVGMTLMVDHGRLDVQVRDLARRRGVILPDQPTADQQRWLVEMRDAPTAADFERVFANRLRAAHGVVLGVIAQVRANTRDDEIRAFAAAANQVVLRHITLLESTGLVDYTQLPQPQSGTASASAGAALDLAATDVITTVVLAALLCGATVLVLWLIRHPARRLKAGDKT
ncbi:DUF4142 domain-containing protein [Amycolatopsis tucumanensis]|uniref:DUF4142 domain-containing protein n=1 Tax=Amycolatopsis tucumanensis TaxID=401106 RepID=A0ABP7IGM1_9PSEU|nr:DUF4142 domain-containing protein [Amycolatopsis tucumanensis]MCF6427726.1 DUF4142 domain-containing protein [Amycolatopsis tucumanensis]